MCKPDISLENEICYKIQLDSHLDPCSFEVIGSSSLAATSESTLGMSGQSKKNKKNSQRHQDHKTAQRGVELFKLFINSFGSVDSCLNWWANTLLALSPCS